MARYKSDPNMERTEWTVKELLATKFKLREYIIPNYLPTGLTILAGRPFAGKSFLALQAANAIDQGGIFLGEQSKKAKCVYIATEDANDDFRARLQGMGFNPNSTMPVKTGWPRFNEGGLVKLKKYLEQGEFTMCVIDSLYKLLSGSKKERDGGMEPILTELHSLCKRGVIGSIVVLYHANKLSVTLGDGGEASISGDSAISAVADSYWMLYHKPDSKQMLLHGEGRKLRKLDIEVHFDALTLSWKATTKKDKVKEESIRGLLLRTLKQNGKANVSLLAKLTDKPIALISRELLTLADDDIITRLPKEGSEVFYEIKPLPSSLSFLH